MKSTIKTNKFSWYLHYDSLSNIYDVCLRENENPEDPVSDKVCILKGSHFLFTETIEAVIHRELEDQRTTLRDKVLCILRNASLSKTPTIGRYHFSELDYSAMYSEILGYIPFKNSFKLEKTVMNDRSIEKVPEYLCQINGISMYFYNYPIFNDSTDVRNLRVSIGRTLDSLEVPAYIPLKEFSTAKINGEELDKKFVILTLFNSIRNIFMARLSYEEYIGIMYPKSNNRSACIKQTDKYLYDSYKKWNGVFDFLTRMVSTSEIIAILETLDQNYKNK